MRPTNVRDEFAELYVAGLFADRGWTIYFPRRDKGFDFIATMPKGNDMLVRPVQVKGVYPEAIKGDKKTFGRTMTLTALHPQMVLAMPFFQYAATKAASPTYVGFFPITRNEDQDDNEYKIQPAKLTNGVITIRKESQRFFGEEGIAAVSALLWGGDKTLRLGRE